MLILGHRHRHSNVCLILHGRIGIGTGTGTGIRATEKGQTSGIKDSVSQIFL